MLQLLPAISNFTVHQNTALPSDHAAISACINTQLTPGYTEHAIKETQGRASALGSRPELSSGAQPEETLQTRRPIRTEHIDRDQATASISAL